MEDLMKKIAELVPTLQGWCTVEKAQWLARWIVDHECLEVVEIGVFGGRSLIPMAMGMKFLDPGGWVATCQVYGVDPYSNVVAEADDLDDANRNWWKTVDLDTVHRSAKEAVIRLNLGSLVTFLVKTSVQAIVEFDNSSLDLVHVDGSHNEKASTRDVQIWWPKLKVGGVMVMDDADWAQVQPARKIAASLGNLVHQDPKWEVYQKVALPQEKLPRLHG